MFPPFAVDAEDDTFQKNLHSPHFLIKAYDEDWCVRYFLSKATEDGATTGDDLVRLAFE